MRFFIAFSCQFANVCLIREYRNIVQLTVENTAALWSLLHNTHKTHELITRALDQSVQAEYVVFPIA